MATAKRILDEWEVGYFTALKDHLLGGDESSLQRAYQLGRLALDKGRGVIDVVVFHCEALEAVLEEAGVSSQANVAIRNAGSFFAEAMSPFEMTHRAFGEAKAALRHLNEALEIEAKRIAHSLHDEAGQLLAAVHVKLDGISSNLPQRTREQLQEVRILLDRVDEQLRRLAHELRPAILDDLGLVPALEFLADGFAQRTGLRIRIDASERGRFPPQTETALYRVVQEALQNVAKHAHASEVKIRIWRTDDSVCCSIRDNGCGFDWEPSSSKSRSAGLGLLGIRERLNALGGEVQIRSAPGKGTELIILAPQGG